MKTHLGLAVVVLLTAMRLTAQETSTLYSHPAVPAREALDRLHMKLGWRAFVPMESRRDGIFTIQYPEATYLRKTSEGMVPARQILVQTRSSGVFAFDPETGEMQWRARVGIAYRAAQPLAANAHSVLVLNGETIYALDRRTGQQQWEFEMPAGAAAPPVASEQAMYLSLANGRLYNYILPDLELLKTLPPRRPQERLPDPVGGQRDPLYAGYGSPIAAVGPISTARAASQAEILGPQPTLLWDYVSDLSAEQTPLVTAAFWFLPSASGTAFTMSKVVPKELYRFRTGGTISVAAAQHSIKLEGQLTDVAYLASGDTNLYAINILTGEALWTFTNGSKILRKPEVTDDSVYIVTEREGLQRLNRETGAAWSYPNPLDPKRRIERRPTANANRFLAANPKFLYALDRAGRLLVIDNQRGTELSMLNTRDFTVPFSNELSDRVYLAANDGLVVCLHDRDHARALATKNPAVLDGGGRANPLNNKLRDSITLEKGLKKTSFKEALTFFSDRYRLPFVVADQAFKDSGMEGVLDKEVALPARQNVPLGDVLNELLKQVKAVYVVMPDHVLIVPKKAP